MPPKPAAVVRMDLLGANPDPTIQPQDKLPGITNYLMGSTRTKWPTNLPTYAKTRSRNVYPGIDLVYYGTQGQLEYDFVLAPRADPSTDSPEVRRRHASRRRLGRSGPLPRRESRADRHKVPQTRPLSAGQWSPPTCEREIHRRQQS